MVLQKSNPQGKCGHTEQGPEHLLVCVGMRSPADQAVGQVQPVDHHQAEAVEQRHHRQEQWVGVRGEAPDGQMGSSE